MSYHVEGPLTVERVKDFCRDLPETFTMQIGNMQYDMKRIFDHVVCLSGKETVRVSEEGQIDLSDNPFRAGLEAAFTLTKALHGEDVPALS